MTSTMTSMTTQTMRRRCTKSCEHLFTADAGAAAPAVARRCHGRHSAAVRARQSGAIANVASVGATEGGMAAPCACTSAWARGRGSK
mmetsp:Transcript_9804/g.21865  ORF Transcript_9804/g.21865 Transcript_9804/m.21865 type:complete len:87 (-) Transcript_9804:451-711(-)